MKLFPVALVGFGLWSCKEKPTPASDAGTALEDKSFVAETGKVHFTRYDQTYQGDLAESVRQMIGAENNQDFMKHYVEFSEKNPNFWEIGGNLRLILVGLKGRIAENKPLNSLEKGAAHDLAELLILAKELPASEPYQDAKVHIASAYADVDVSIAPKLVEDSLSEGIAQLSLAAMRETEVSK